MYNAPSRVAPPRLSTPLSSSKRNDLLCTTLRTPLLTAPPCIASTRSSVCRSAARLNSTICLLQRRRSAAPRVASPRTSTLFNDLFVTFRASTRGHLSHSVAAPRIAPQRNDLFITSRLHATSLNPTPRGAFQRNDLFITSQRQHCSPLRHARLRAFAQDHAP